MAARCQIILKVENRTFWVSESFRFYLAAFEWDKTGRSGFDTF